MYEKLKQVLVEEMSINPDDIKPDAELIGDLGFNSLELADLVVLCEEKFDIVFLDPPYASGLLQQALTDIAAFDICRAHGIIIAESAVDTVLPEMPAPYALYREYRYGKIKLTVYHRGGNEDTE